MGHDGLLELALELLQNLLGLVHRPVDAVHLVGEGVVVEHVPGSHQLHHALQPARRPDVARGVLGGAAHHQLLGPVHVARGEPVAAAGQLRAHVRGPPRLLVGRRERAVLVQGVQARLGLVAGVDAGALHKVSEHVEGE